MPRCRSRITSEKTIQRFGDKTHKFYLEERCPNEALEDRLTCSTCTIKSVAIQKKQDSRRFPHGNIDEPIPPESHLFGGSWYEEGVKKWGEPPAHVILCALRYQEQARGVLSKVVEPDLSTETSSASASSSPSPPRTMARPKKAATATTAATASKKKEIQGDLPLSNDLPSEPPKRVRRPRVSKKMLETLSLPLPPLSEESKEEAVVLPVSSPAPPAPPAPVPAPKTKRPRKKAAPAAPVVPSLLSTHKDSCIPTYYEETMEETSLSDYETEWVPLTLFSLNDTLYFRDARKNKLYRRIKEKTLGPYVGRYDPLTESLNTEIPDSDAESE